MIAVVAEKPSVGMDIARVLGCRERGDGFVQGAGYIVTWAVGHLVSQCEPDADALRENLLAGFESLTDAEREAFDANFMDVVRLLDACMEDWEANRALFGDAGKADLMDAALSDPDGPLSWQSIRNHTLTMGNSDE